MAVIPQADAPFRASANPFMDGALTQSSLMDRATNRRLAEQRGAQEQAIFDLAMPLKVAQTKAQIVKAQTDYDIALGNQEARSQALEQLKDAAGDIHYVNAIPDLEASANGAIEFINRYGNLANVAELAPTIGPMLKIAQNIVENSMKQNLARTAQIKTLDILKQQLSPEDYKQAVRVQAGLEPKASVARYQGIERQGADGTVQSLTLDKQTGQYIDPQTGLVIGRASPPRAAAPVQTDQPTEDSAAAVEPTATGATPFRGQSTREKSFDTQQGKDEAEYQTKLKTEKPKRTVALRQAELGLKRNTTDIDDLIKNVSAATAGPGGALLKNFPGTTAHDFELDLGQLKAAIAAETLQAMRQSSPTGGALGNISDRDVRLLEEQLAALSVGQSPENLLKNLNKLKSRLTDSFEVNRMAYDQEYGGAQPGATAPEAAVETVTVQRITPDQARKMTDAELDAAIKSRQRSK